MTKKDYKLIAEVLRQSLISEANKRQLVQEMNIAFLNENARFSQNLFFKAVFKGDNEG